MNAWRHIKHPLTLVLRRRWAWGNDPRAPGRVCLVSPRGAVFEIRHNRAGTFARRFQHFALN